jgi:hypothetical protein
MTPFQTNFLGATPFSDYNIAMNLLSAQVYPVTIPGTAQTKYRAKFSWPYDANVWVCYNQTPLGVPPGTSAITNGSICELNPDIKYIKGGDILYIISRAVVLDANIALLVIPG